jgi:hypothetical protein
MIPTLAVSDCIEQINKIQRRTRLIYQSQMTGFTEKEIVSAGWAVCDILKKQFKNKMLFSICSSNEQLKIFAQQV